MSVFLGVIITLLCSTISEIKEIRTIVHTKRVSKLEDRVDTLSAKYNLLFEAVRRNYEMVARIADRPNKTLSHPRGEKPEDKAPTTDRR